MTIIIKYKTLSILYLTNYINHINIYLKEHTLYLKMTDHKNDQTLINLVVKDLKDSITQEENTESSNKYVVLMETSGEECESWYYCIKYDGNEKNLEYLHKQLESIDWYILDDLSTFDLDLDHFISEKTAKELTKLELNHYFHHRKFDGVLDKIELNLRNKDENEKKMVKVFDILGQVF